MLYQLDYQHIYEIRENVLEFTCGALPDVIELERMCYDHANSFNLIAAKNYTTAVVPFQVVLEITFDEDHNDK